MFWHKELTQYSQGVAGVEVVTVILTHSTTHAVGPKDQYLVAPTVRSWGLDDLIP